MLSGMGTAVGLVVSGFLGSGKTTLVRQLLDHAQRTGRRVAVISNEFGELGIDQALLGNSAEAYVELEGGCVCCKLSDDLVATLQQLHERVNPEQVIIETSGVGLPYDTQLNFWREPVSQWIVDDLAAVVVNAEQVALDRELVGTFEDQVSSADLIVLNKVDLVDAQQLARVEARLAELSGDTQVVRCVKGDVDPDLLLLAMPSEARTAPAPREPRPHRHEQFATEELRVADGVEMPDLLERLRGLDALRIKGFVQTSAGLRLVQGVGPRIEVTEVEQNPPASLLGRLVLIRRCRS
jgi:cobalamin biosynthesis protein CobW